MRSRASISILRAVVSGRAGGLPRARAGAAARGRGRLCGRPGPAGVLGWRGSPRRRAPASRTRARAGTSVRVHRRPLRATPPAYARRRRVAMRGQRGRDRLHGRRTRGRGGAPGRRTGLVLRRAARSRYGRADMRRSVARFSRWTRPPDGAAARCTKDPRAGSAIATRPRTRWRRPAIGRIRASTAAAARGAGAYPNGRRRSAGWIPTARPAVAASAAAWGARETDTRGSAGRSGRARPDRTCVPQGTPGSRRDADLPAARRTAGAGRVRCDVFDHGEARLSWAGRWTRCLEPDRRADPARFSRRRGMDSV
jgi:hypothetical protein